MPLRSHRQLYIDCLDDAIWPKASPSMGMANRRAVEDLVVSNCVLRTNCNNFKFGTESSGGSNGAQFQRARGY